MFDADGGQELSLLDILACGLGACVLLALVFMALRQAPQDPAVSSSSLVLRVDVDDPDALLGIVLAPPGQPAFDVDLRDLPSGTRVRCDSAEPSPGALDCLLFGFSHGGTSTVVPEDENAPARHLAHLLNPLIGGWRVGVRYMGRREPMGNWVGSTEPEIRLLRCDVLGGTNDFEPRVPANLALGQVHYCSGELVIVER